LNNRFKALYLQVDLGIIISLGSLAFLWMLWLGVTYENIHYELDVSVDRGLELTTKRLTPTLTMEVSDD
jgi:hypothetical protein